MSDRKTQLSPRRRGLLQSLAGVFGLAAGARAALASTAGGSHDSAADEGGQVIAKARVPVFASLAKAERAHARGEIGADVVVDILGHQDAGDGGGFRGVALARADALLPGAGLIEPFEAMLDVRMFGPTGTAAEATKTLQQALNWSSARQHVVRLAARFDIDEPLKVGVNAGLVGLGSGFRSGLRPVDCPALVLDGQFAENGWIFNVLLRDFSIWGDRVRSPQPYALKLDQCYRSAIENVTLRGYGVSRDRTRSVVEISGKQNHVIFDRLTVLGEEPGPGCCGVRIANSSQAGQLHFSHIDVEKTGTCVVMEPGAQAQFLNPYFERFETGIAIKPGVRSLVVHGGIFRFQNQRAPGLLFADGRYGAGEHVALMGSVFQPPRPGVPCTGIAGENVIWDNPYPVELAGIDQAAASISPALRGAARL
ncbi:MAG: hypothetical protein AAF559_04225 [Pseudomonadota bacterium]